jgi:hypothetical protein
MSYCRGWPGKSAGRLLSLPDTYIAPVMRRTAAMAAVLLTTAGCSEAFAWGCEGHRAVAMLAERLLPTATRSAVTAVLRESPGDPGLKRVCDPVPSDLIADVATWADDERTADPATGGWHFINFPRSLGSNTSSYKKYCAGGNCAIDAIVAQFQTLKTSSSATRKANALRFVIHLVGDLHQPLHAITNGDRGGNCVPVWYFGQPPQEDDRGNFTPNLHAVWDSATIRTLMTKRGLPDARALADHIAGLGGFPHSVTAAAATSELVASWARDANAHARTVAYGRLPVGAPLEPATAITLTSCADNHDVVHRMLALRDRIDDAYEQASVPVITGQLRLAAIHLAQLLKAAFPEP